MIAICEEQLAGVKGKSVRQIGAVLLLSCGERNELDQCASSDHDRPLDME